MLIPSISFRIGSIAIAHRQKKLKPTLIIVSSMINSAILFLFVETFFLGFVLLYPIPNRNMIPFNKAG
jgi:hypothetical protein